MAARPVAIGVGVFLVVFVALIWALSSIDPPRTKRPPGTFVIITVPTSTDPPVMLGTTTSTTYPVVPTFPLDELIAPDVVSVVPSTLLLEPVPPVEPVPVAVSATSIAAPPPLTIPDTTSPPITEPPMPTDPPPTDPPPTDPPPTDLTLPTLPTLPTT